MSDDDVIIAILGMATATNMLTQRQDVVMPPKDDDDKDTLTTLELDGILPPSPHTVAIKHPKVTVTLLHDLWT